ncbi:MAG TPA: hypothetical protein VF476_04120 [Chitinophagaceae bacterium]
MKIGFAILMFAALSFSLASCSEFTFTPRSKKRVQQEKPSVGLLNMMIAYREEQQVWPFSKQDFISKGLKYKTAFDGFPYNYTNFKVVDENEMIFYFSDHRRDAAAYQQTGKIELNSLGGRVRFYKDKNKFVWKLKMN